jgi:phosphonatase-like hydrolase
MMRIDLVVFDLMSLVRDDGAMLECLHATLAELGAVVHPHEASALMGRSTREMISTLLEGGRDGLACSDDEVERAHHAFVLRMIHRFENDPGVREVPGARSTLARLRRGRVSVAVDTALDRRVARVVLSRMGWARDRLVDFTVASDEVSRGRPHPDTIVRAMAMLGVRDRKRVAKVGDTQTDLVQGTCAGCGLVVGLASGPRGLTPLMASPHTHLVRTVVALPDLLPQIQERQRRWSTAS